MMELFAIYVLAFSVTDLAGYLMSFLGLIPQGEGSALKSLILVALGAISFWLVNKALVYRKAGVWLTYILFGGSVILASWLGTVPFMKELSWLILPAMLYTAFDSYFWLPANAKINANEVCINQTIAQAFKKRNIFVVTFWIVLVIGFALTVQFRLMSG